MPENNQDHNCNGIAIEDMVFDSRLSFPVIIDPVMAYFKNSKGEDMEAEYNAPILVDAETDICHFKCPCCKIDAIAYWDKLSNGEPALVVGTLPKYFKIKTK